MSRVRAGRRGRTTSHPRALASREQPPARVHDDGAADVFQQASIAPVVGVGDGVFHFDLVDLRPFLRPVTLAVAVAGRA